MTQTVLDDHGLIQSIQHSTERFAERINYLLGPDETGGWLCIALFENSRWNARRHHVPIGLVPIEKTDRYERNSGEKVNRLIIHPEHHTSRESRNEEASQYGGAIRANPLILSFSGFPEIWDEALMFRVALEEALLTSHQISDIASDEVFEAYSRLLLPS